MLDCNTAPETILEQVRFNSERPGLKWLQPTGRRLKHVCIVGGAPSLKDNIESLRRRKRRGQAIWALNGVHDYLIGHKIIPDVCVIVDAQEHNIEFLRNPHPKVGYLIASRCHPSLFDALEGYNVTLWHTWDEGAEDYLKVSRPGKPWAVFAGGGTVALRTLAAVEGLGGKNAHLFGVDSSYQDDVNHAYSQPMNDGEKVEEVYIGDRQFRAAPWMIKQVEDFHEQFRQLTEKGIKISVHGEGLLPYVASLMGQAEESSFH